MTPITALKQGDTIIHGDRTVVVWEINTVSCQAWLTYRDLITGALAHDPATYPLTHEFTVCSTPAPRVAGFVLRCVACTEPLTPVVADSEERHVVQPVAVTVPALGVLPGAYRHSSCELPAVAS